MGGGGRGHEFNPETSDPKSFSRSVLRDNKEKVTRESQDAPADEKISYGRKFSQTEELYTARQMERELEELAREDGMLDDEEPASPKARPRAAKKPRSEVRAELPEPPRVARSGPIGALPPISEPPPRARLTEVVDDAERYVRMIRGGVRDVTTAALRLARLPLEVAALAVQRIRPLKA